MNGKKRKQQLWRQTLEVSREHPPADAAAAGPGDLFVCDRTADFAVEWAILEIDPRHGDPRYGDPRHGDPRQGDPRQGGRALVVPADLDPRVGTADVALAGDPACGSLTLRCGFAQWIDVAALDPAMRTGTLPAADLERGRAKRIEIAAGSATGSISERETEAEPGYRSLQRELGRARAALSLWAPLTAPTADELPPAVLPMVVAGRTPPAAFFARPAALAASILLLLSLGFGTGWLLQSRKTAELTRAREQSTAELRQSLEQRTEQNREIERIRRQEREEHQGLLATLRRELAELRARGESPPTAGPRSLINLPLAFFPAVGTVRGPAKILTVHPEASHLVLVLDVDGSLATYRLEIFAQDPPRLVWSRDRLDGKGLAELTVALPRQLFPAGSYRIRLSGSTGETSEELAEHLLQIREP